MPEMPDIQRLLDRELWLVTSAFEDQRAGMIATFVNHASIVPELPRMLVGIAKQHHTWKRIEASGVFTLHLFDESLLDWVWRFGAQSGHAVDKFAGLTTARAANGCPRVSGALAWLDCRVETSMDTGDRTVYLAEVLESRIEKPGEPLTTSRLAQLMPADRLRELRESLERDSAIDGAAIHAWRKRQ